MSDNTIRNTVVDEQLNDMFFEAQSSNNDLTQYDRTAFRTFIYQNTHVFVKQHFVRWLLVLV